MSDAPEKQTGLGPIDGLFRGIVAICRVMTGVALVAMTLLLGYQVFGRYVMNDTPTWIDPLSLLLVMLIAFLGAGIGVYENTHLSVVILRNIVSRKIRSILVVLTDFMMVGFGGAMLWYGAQLTMFKWKSQIPLIHLPEGLRSLPLTICGGMIFIFAIGHLVRHLMGRDTRTDNIE